MSLICTNCNKDMGPSEELPGREGTLVTPVLTSLVYLPLGGGSPSYETAYLAAPQNASLCFECIETAIPRERKEKLREIYDVCGLETAYRMIEESQKGRFVGGRELIRVVEAEKRFSESLDALEEGCLFCGENVRDGNPFFVSRVIDRVYSVNHLSGVFQFNNYSFSNLRQGRTSFGFCFNDFRTHFPKVFEYLSCLMLGKPIPGRNAQPNELYIGSGVAEAIEGKTGMSFDEFLDRQVTGRGLDGIKIIRREDESGGC